MTGRVCRDCKRIYPADATGVRAGRCPACTRAWRRTQPTNTERGYDAAHRRLRAAYAARMAAGEQFVCARCREPIMPGQAWALDHTDDRRGYLGPSHQRCNNRAGGQARWASCPRGPQAATG